ADNAAEILATTSGPDARAKAWNMVRERSAQDPNGSYWMYPRGHTTDAEGRIQEVPYQVVKFNPDAPLKHDMTIAFPSTDPDGGVSMHDFTVHPPATYREFLAIRESMKAAATQALASGMKAEQKEATDRILTTDENGNAIILPRYQAAERNLNTTGKAINPQQELKLNYNKGQFSIVQSQLSQYSDAFNAVNALPEEIRQRDAKTMLSLIEESKQEGVFKGQINLPEIGSLKVPVVSSLQSALDNIFKQTQFQNMDQASQRLWRTYSQFLPNMQLYNRVVDDTARAVGMKGVVEAEQKNVPTPYDLMVNPQANAPYLDNWQNNMNLINKYVPGGMEAINEVRRQNEHTFGAPKVDISKKPPGAAGYAKGKKGWYWIDKDNKIIAPLGGTPPAQ
ncbi:MAG: hypothetical protein J2P37_35690, partial [Ktedonobacteraceae bacterium]|nr:hypothetical protein [Ktedonobacteraceae bacterium]